MSSFGEELRRERELRRITLREVADATKINLRYLEALDKNDFKHLPGGVFNRGFVRAYAQFIGIDPEQMVSAYLMEEQTQAQGGGAGGGEKVLRGKTSGNPAGEEKVAASGSGSWFKIGVAIVLVAALIAAGVFLYLKFLAETAAGRGAESASSKTEVAPATGPAPRETAADIVPRLVKLPDRGEDAREAGNTGDDATPPALVPISEKPPIEPVATTTPDVPPASRPPAGRGPLLATIYVDRATTGRLNCDNRQLDLLTGMPPGTRFELSCSEFLIVDADDGSALRIGWPGIAPAAPGAAGVPLSGHRIDLQAIAVRQSTGDRP